MHITILHNPFMPVEFLDGKCMFSILNNLKTVLLCYCASNTKVHSEAMFSLLP